MLRHTASLSRAALFAWPERSLDDDVLATLDHFVESRLGGVPLAYLIGSRDFWSLSLTVTPAVLIPRPDTEALVERALLHLGTAPAREEGWIVEAGTGSGAIAIALATECDRPLLATDRSADALSVAQGNAVRLLEADRVEFLEGDWLDALCRHSVTMLVSNPPYLAEDDPHLTALSAEPAAALVSGRDGLDAIRRLIDDAVHVCVPEALVILEHGYTQAEAVRGLFAAHGFFNIVTTRDLAGLDRVTEARSPRRTHHVRAVANDT